MRWKQSPRTPKITSSGSVFIPINPPCIVLWRSGWKNCLILKELDKKAPLHGGGIEAGQISLPHERVTRQSVM